MAVNETLNATVNATAQSGFDATHLWPFIKEYFFGFPELIARGDMFSLIIAMLLAFVIIVLLNKITDLLILVLKKSLIFILTGFAAFYFYRGFMTRLAAEGWTVGVALFGLVGIVVSIMGLVIAFYALIFHTKEGIKFKGDVSKIPEKELQTKFKGSNMFSLSSITNDKSLLSVMTYMLVAQFGVFSSKTISAPTVKIGLVLFIVVAAGSFIFIKQSYKDYKIGLEHLGVTFVASLVLSLLLGYFWGGYSFSTLFSMQYFVTDSLVAMISGVALSLFVGSKG